MFPVRHIACNNCRHIYILCWPTIQCPIFHNEIISRPIELRLSNPAQHISDFKFVWLIIYDFFFQVWLGRSLTKVPSRHTVYSEDRKNKSDKSCKVIFHCHTDFESAQLTSSKPRVTAIVLVFIVSHSFCACEAIALHAIGYGPSVMLILLGLRTASMNRGSDNALSIVSFSVF